MPVLQTARGGRNVMRSSHVRTTIGRVGIGASNCSSAPGIAGRHATRASSDSPAAGGGNPVLCIVAGMALLACAGCTTQADRVDPATVATSQATDNRVVASPPEPVAQLPEAQGESGVLADALATETHEEAVSLVSAAAGLPAEGDEKEAADLAKARQLGYRIVDKNGETVYCHDSVATGSHLRKETICLTRRQWENVSTNSAREMQKLQGTMNPCPGKGGCGG